MYLHKSIYLFKNTNPSVAPTRVEEQHIFERNIEHLL